jgi:hypothetical protein
MHPPMMMNYQVVVVLDIDFRRLTPFFFGDSRNFLVVDFAVVEYYWMRTTNVLGLMMTMFLFPDLLLLLLKSGWDEIEIVPSLVETHFYCCCGGCGCWKYCYLNHDDIAVVAAVVGGFFFHDS